MHNKLIVLGLALLVVGQIYAFPLAGEDRKQLMDSASVNNETFAAIIFNADASVYNDPHTSLRYAEDAMQMAWANNSKEQEAIAANKMGGAYWSIGDLAKAFKYLKKSMELARELNDTALEARCLGNIAVVYATVGDKSQAIAFDMEALPIFIKSNNKNRIITMYNNIGESYTYLNQFDSAEHYLNKALLEAFDEEEEFKAIIYYNLGELYFNRKLYPRAKVYLEQSLEQALKFGDIRIQCHVYSLLAEIAIMDGDNNKALFYAKNASFIAESIRSKVMKYLTYSTYAKALEVNKEYQAASKYALLSNSYRDSVQTQEAENRLSFFNFLKEEGEIALLKKEKELASFIEERVSFYINGLILLLILLTIFFVIIFISRKEKIHANKKLEKINKEVESQKMAIEMQRRKLENLNKSKDKIFSIVTHDFRSPLNSLKSLLMMIEDQYITMEDFKALLPEVSKKLNSTSTLLENILLWAQVQINSEHFKAGMINLKEQIGMQISFCDIELANKNITIKETVNEKYQVFIDPNIVGIVIRNIIGNAIKFSHQNGTVYIHSREEEEYCVLEITDEGVGMSEKESSMIFQNLGKSKDGTNGEKGSGFGLQLSKDFIESSGGNITVKSLLGKGTTFSIHIPKNKSTSSYIGVFTANTSVTA